MKWFYIPSSSIFGPQFYSQKVTWYFGWALGEQREQTFVWVPNLMRYYCCTKSTQVSYLDTIVERADTKALKFLIRGQKTKLFSRQCKKKLLIVKAILFEEGCILEFIFQVLARCDLERQAKHKELKVICDFFDKLVKNT